MTIPFKINNLTYDEFGRASGVLAVNKPIGVGSHSVVDFFRRKFKTSRVGHAGALDPFASGILIILIGKATGYSDHFLKLDKEYIAHVLFGLSTDTSDPEGVVSQESVAFSRGLKHLDKKLIDSAIKRFQPEYDQHVPLFSSVKVDGQKLRVLARRYHHFEVEKKGEARVVKFYNEKNELKNEVNLPQKRVKIYEIELLDLYEKEVFTDNAKTHSYASLQDSTSLHINASAHLYPIAKIRVKCSKGTYIRQLAVDIGEKLGVPAMLIKLERTKVGGTGINDSLELASFESDE